MLKTLFFLLASGKLGQVLLTGGTMLISVIAYGWIFGLPYAAGFVLLLLVHEMGHYIAARQCGLDVGAPTFIPFVGAWIELKDQPHDAEIEAYVAMAGPLIGSIGAVAVYLAGRQLDSNLMLAIAYAGLFLNLFNLLPISPLDGGRITAIISPRIWLIGAPLLLALLFWRPSPVLILIAIISIPQVMRAWRYDPQAPENIAYYGIPTQTRLEYGAAYLALTGFLAIMTYELHEMLSHVHRNF